MINVTTNNEGIVSIHIEGTEMQIFSEMCALFYNLRHYHKEMYLDALKYARETSEKESEEDD